MPREKPLSAENLTRPPIRRYTGPIVDCHTHTGSPETARLLFEVAGRFGIARLLGITHFDEMDAVAAAFGPRFRPILWVERDLAAGPEASAAHNVRLLHEGRARGAVAGKFWYAPRLREKSRARFDDAALDPVFRALADLGMPALVHVADPDCWFATRYTDTALYGTKAEQYEQLENVLARVPDLVVVAAHFGGDPEHLDHLHELLGRYPNLLLDSSATKWIVRELSIKPEESRAFVLEHADRIVFGSDLVAFDGAAPEDYASRYWAHRWLWEGKGLRGSPIPDPCAPWPTGPMVHGLDLPEDVLRRLYHDNPCRVFGLNE